MEKNIVLYDLLILKKYAEEVGVKTPDKIPFDEESMEQLLFELGLGVLRTIFPTCIVNLDNKGYSVIFDDPMYQDLIALSRRISKLRNYPETVHFGRELMNFSRDSPFNRMSSWKVFSCGIETISYLDPKTNEEKTRYIGYMDKSYCKAHHIFINPDDELGMSGLMFYLDKFQRACKKYYKSKYRFVKRRLEDIYELCKDQIMMTVKTCRCTDEIFRSIYEDEIREYENQIENTHEESSPEIILIGKMVSEEQQEEFNKAIAEVQSSK